MFAEHVKEASWEVHDHAEKSAFIGRLLSGGATLAEYANLVAQHYYIYSVLEEAAEVMRSNDVAGPFAAPQLNRLHAVESDLATLLGGDWHDQIVAIPETTEYVNRLREVCFDWPGGFVAHHYVRYLGDLSGGQIIRRILARTYGFEGDAGIRFYVFDQIDNGVQFKKDYRTLLDTAPWDDDEHERITGEVIRAFEMNGRILDALG